MSQSSTSSRQKVSRKGTEMGKKIEEAYFRLSNETRHHTKLALAKQTDYENGFASGFAEALRIVAAIRDGKQ